MYIYFLCYIPLNIITTIMFIIIIIIIIIIITKQNRRGAGEGIEGKRGKREEP